jgi:hypothetical protein
MAVYFSAAIRLQGMVASNQHVSMAPAHDDGVVSTVRDGGAQSYNARCLCCVGSTVIL